MEAGLRAGFFVSRNRLPEERMSADRHEGRAAPTPLPGLWLRFQFHAFSG